jgi:hypothetical protein
VGVDSNAGQRMDSATNIHALDKRAGTRREVTRPGWDALLLALLVFAHLQVLSLAEQAALPLRLQDVLRHPVLGNILPPAGEAAMGDIGPRPGEPIGLVLNALTLGGLLFYFVVDLAARGAWRQRLKWLCLTLILVTALFLPATKLILLRQGSGPASYTHDGGVIQTEATIRYLLAGQNPYVEDYVDTPMAEWGFSEYRTALYHYPYLPWTFLFSAPAYLVGDALGFYDQRVVYLALLAIALAAAPRLARDPTSRLALVATLGLNPIMALDVIFGQNDSFVLCWLIFSLVFWALWRADRQKAPAGKSAGRWKWVASAVFFGLACASKPTAWFMAPFYGVLLLEPERSMRLRGLADLLRQTPRILARAWPALLVFGLIVLPYVLWNPHAFYDDVWRWSSGQGETGYQIWGWGASNFVLALGWVPDRFAEWPFWLLEIIVAAPLLLWFLHRQAVANTLSNACWHYAVLLFAFFYASRFLNENYLGYILAFLAIGIFSQFWRGDGMNKWPSSPE